MDDLIQWLLEGPAWVQYSTRRYLLKQSESDDDVISARRSMLEDAQLQALIAGQDGWETTILNSHKSAGHPIHQLTFLADLGLKAFDPGMQPLIDRILDHCSDEGPFQVLMNIPKAFGGSGEDQWAWALCDAPLVLYALARFGLADDGRVQKGTAFMAHLVRDNGWGCSASPELGKFRGPGRKDDPCPFANLAMLKLLAQLPAWQDSGESHLGVETLLRLWETRRENHPYMFYMGSDFCKLKLPFVWYDILHVADVISRFVWAGQDPRLLDLVGIIQAKADSLGRFTPESVWTAWKNWEFGQKKVPSRWLTLRAHILFRRMQTRPA